MDFSRLAGKIILPRQPSMLANNLFLAAPKNGLKNQRPGKTEVGNEVNEHRYRQAAYGAESVGSHNTKRPGVTYEPPPYVDMLERPDDATG